MSNKKELIKFNMTDEMSSSLIEFNKLKHDLNNLKNDTKEKNNEKKIIIEKRLDELKKIFINEFKKNNKVEIQIYLKQKDQN